MSTARRYENIVSMLQVIQTNFNRTPKVWETKTDKKGIMSKSDPTAHQGLGLLPTYCKSGNLPGDDLKHSS